MKICGIYKITSPSNKVYIGQSVDITSRWKRYYALTCKSQTRLYRSLLKRGVGCHKFEILCQCGFEELNNLEIFYIELYQSFNSEFGMNLRGGGERSKMSEITKSRISVANKGKKRSEEVNEKNRKAQTGKRATEETKLKISLAGKGRKQTKESIIKQINTKRIKGPYIVTDSTRRKMSLSRTGKVLSVTHKNNIGKSSQKKVFQKSLNGGGIIKNWESIKSASEYLKVNGSGIGRCCKGEQKTAYGYIWEYMPVPAPINENIK